MELVVTEAHMWHLSVPTYYSKKMSQSNIRAWINSYTSTVVICLPNSSHTYCMPRCCTKNELLRQFCVCAHKAAHGWQHKKHVCGTSRATLHVTVGKTSCNHSLQPVTPWNRSSQQWAEFNNIHTTVRCLLAELVQVRKATRKFSVSQSAVERFKDVY